MVVERDSDRRRHRPDEKRLDPTLQFIEQRLGVFQICGVEALGEPVVDVAQHRTSLVAFALLPAMMMFLVEKGELTREELILRGADPIALAQPAGHFEGRLQTPARKKARFREGNRVVARNINPIGHTRLPRYVRGKRGVIHRDWGIYAFPDSSVHNAGECSQHVYSVAFTARELWGTDAPARDTLRIDLWEDYLVADPVAANTTKHKPPPPRRKKR